MALKRLPFFTPLQFFLRGFFFKQQESNANYHKDGKV